LQFRVNPSAGARARLLNRWQSLLGTLVSAAGQAHRSLAKHEIARSIAFCQFATFNSRKSTEAGNLVPQLR
jgi:hypothetical protein